MFSMYQGLLLGLAGIWGAALVLSFIDQLAFTPTELSLSLAVLVVSVLGASWLFGRLFGVAINYQSSWITAFILALIMTPSDTMPGLLALGLAGLVAAASKFVLVYKNRHIFNPAAVAAVIVGLLGLSTASWWVATPLLTPIVVAVVAISIYQTKRYALVATFLGTSILLILANLLLSGADLLAASLLLLSWPIFFLGGIMLTEPLTLPPRKWQMVIVAAVVGILVALPFKIGFFAMTPALALLIGNAIAFFFAKRQGVRLTLVERRSLTPTTDEFVFKTPQPVKYEAGQFMEITVPHITHDLRGERRSFSVTSIPGTTNVTFGIKFYDAPSTYKKRLRALKPGAQLDVSNVSGDFLLPKDTSRPLLFMAGGIGVTPFISYIRTSHKNQEKRDIVLVYAVRSVAEIAYAQDLVKAGVRVVVVSTDTPKKLPPHWHHVQSDRVTEEILKSAVKDVSQRDVYISGPPLFVQALRKVARKNRARRIHTDYFVGY